MKVILAGYNVDVNELEKIKKGETKDVVLTPETFSAAYARISRSPKPVNELREMACSAVDKARVSNERIIFDMGHSSVAEHAVFNFDILKVSRLAMEELEHFRLCSYTEKSQRYITLDDDYVLPAEIAKDKEIKDLFIATISKQNEMYWKLYDKLKAHVFTTNPELAKEDKNKGLLEGWAKEDARYITALATEAQLGMTLNCRNLELMLRRFASSGSEEIRVLGKKMYDSVKDIAPSVIKYCEKTPYESDTYANIASVLKGLEKTNKKDLDDDFVELVSAPEDADNNIISALIHSCLEIGFDEASSIAKNMSEEKKQELIKTVFQDINFYDRVLREFEYATFTYETIVSASCFAQLKRHRMATITTQNYDPDLGVKIPEAIIEVGMEKDFMQVIDETNKAYITIKNKYSAEVASYVLTNAHKRRVLIDMNVRELYHLSRLREDAHAQWDIKNISRKMVDLAKEKAPLALTMICGKDSFNEVREKVYQ